MRRNRIFISAALLSLTALLAACSSKANSVTSQYSLGERAQVGALIYTVFDTKWVPQLGEGITARVPSNRFFLVRVSIVNSGSTDNGVPALSLIDDSGQRYEELSNGDGVAQWIGFIRHIKPTDNLTGYVVFDVAPRHYKLEVADESGENKALVDIPLAFSDDSPLSPTIQLPAPPRSKEAPFPK